jgi:outer membrane lipoprotein-sorting protein
MNVKPTFKKIGIWAFSALFSFVTYSSSAQDSKKILDDLSAKAKSYTTISAEYSSRLLDKQSSVDLTEKGTIKVKGSKYHLDLPSYTIISDGVTVWTYEKENNAVYIDNLADMGNDGMNPNEMFRIWEKGFRHEYKETKTEEGKQLYVINLYPTDPKSKPFHTIQMKVDKAKMEIHSIKVLNRDGSEVSYSLKGFTPNKEIADTVFKFDKAKYPGVEVVDNRL